MNTVRRPCRCAQGGRARQSTRAPGLVTDSIGSLFLFLSTTQPAASTAWRRSSSASSSRSPSQSSPSRSTSKPWRARPLTTRYAAHDRHDTTQDVPRTEPTLTIVRAAIHLARLTVQATAVVSAGGQLQRVLLPHGLPSRGTATRRQEQTTSRQAWYAPPPPHTRNTRASHSTPKHDAVHAAGQKLKHGSGFELTLLRLPSQRRSAAVFQRACAEPQPQERERGQPGEEEGVCLPVPLLQGEAQGAMMMMMMDHVRSATPAVPRQQPLAFSLFSSTNCRHIFRIYPDRHCAL